MKRIAAILALILVALAIIFARREFAAKNIRIEAHHQDFPNARKEVDYYWTERTPTTFHGICAHMYAFDDGSGRWQVEKPWGVDPQTHGSTSTEQETFTSRTDAEKWIEERCPSNGKWHVVEQGVLNP